MREIKKESKKEATKASKPKKEALRQAQGNNSFAIIETGGKQYRVTEGEAIKIEKINGNLKEGDKVVFDKVLLIDNGSGSTDIGTPYISGAKVSGTVIEIGRNAKVIVIKYKQKSRYFKKNGHRQPYLKVKIEKIG